MPYLQDIVTTNWDTYFEEECAATPFVTGEDIALWRMHGRRVLKIHGSMSNLGSIVATESDYQNRLDDLGTNVMGALLKEMLATHTVVFIGYSLRDWNFRRLYGTLLQDMAPFQPRAYFVSPFGIDESDKREFNLIALKTSGVRFLRDLKESNYGTCFIKDSNYDRVAEYHSEILDADLFAKTIPHKKYPSIIYCWAFHDGARDACCRIDIRRGSGEYSSRQHLIGLINYYEKLEDEAWDDGRFFNHAYIVGYSTVLYIMLDDRTEGDDEHPLMLDDAQLYFMYGSDDVSLMRTPDEFRDAVKASNRRAPRQRKWARERIRDLPEGMVIEHDPFLPGLRDENVYAENEHA